jgi:hypothetical protein
VIPAWEAAGDSAMMGRQDRDQGQLFYEFSLIFRLRSVPVSRVVDRFSRSDS